MKKDLPEIFKKQVDNRYAHNKKVDYVSQKEKQSMKVDRKDSVTVEDKIKKLFKSSRYIFNIGVIIKTDKREYDTKIAGKVKNSLITIDNDIIPIIEIRDIIIKDRI